MCTNTLLNNVSIPYSYSVSRPWMCRCFLGVCDLAVKSATSNNKEDKEGDGNPTGMRLFLPITSRRILLCSCHSCVSHVTYHISHITYHDRYHEYRCYLAWTGEVGSKKKRERERHKRLLCSLVRYQRISPDGKAIYIRSRIKHSTFGFTHPIEA
jgi:hypothetical protein